MPAKQIVIATRNKGKVAEITEILAGLPLELIGLDAFPGLGELIEDGATLEENALKKARQTYEATGLPSLADDSGLEVFHLDMQPGVISARYAGEHVTYEQNNAKLLAALAGVPLSQRVARFRCVALLFDGTMEKMTTGICHGVITTAPGGHGGFGYDPIFQQKGYEQTVAELPISIKNSMSHRAKAFRAMRVFLESYL